MAYMKSLSGVRLDSYDPADEAVMIDPQTGLGELAYAENVSAQQTIISAAAVSVGFCVVVVEPTEAELWIEWSCRLGIVTPPGVTYGGSLDGVVWEVTLVGSTPTVTEVDRDPHDVPAGRPAKADFARAHGAFHIGPTTTERMFALGAGRTLDNVASALVGSVRNQPSAKSYIRAVAL